MNDVGSPPPFRAIGYFQTSTSLFGGGGGGIPLFLRSLPAALSLSLSPPSSALPQCCEREEGGEIAMKREKRKRNFSPQL